MSDKIYIGTDSGATTSKIAAVFPPRGAVTAQAQPQTQPQAQQVALRPASPPQARANANWGVQVGAYSDAAIGQQALSSLTASMPDFLANADPQVQKVAVGGTTMYRARLMALDKKTAQSICSYLIQRGKSCLTVEP